MSDEEIKAITLEGLKESFGKEICINNELFSENKLSQSLGDSNYRIDVVYNFTKSAIDGKKGVSLVYAAKGDNGVCLEEAATMFTGYLEYDIKGVIDEMVKLDYPMIHHFFTREPVEDEKLTYMEAVHYNPFQVPKIVQGWKVYVGVQKRVQDESVTYIPPTKEQELFHVLHGAINKALYPQPKPYFIKCWITAVKGKGLWADCRVNMQDWDLGRDLLFDYAERWEVNWTKCSLKQSLLLVPTPMEELERGKEILSQMESHFAEHIKEMEKQKQAKKKFWEFWK